MKKILGIFLVGLMGCQYKMVPDQAPASIDVGMKRVETEICGNYGVGENGCVFPQGKLSGDLKIYRVISGFVNIIGQGCRVDTVIKYEADAKNPWLSIPLESLVGTSVLEDDCVLDIYQFVRLPDSEDQPIPVRGIYGTVTLGTCPEDVVCSFDAEQMRAGWIPRDIRLEGSGDYLVRGCGEELARGTFQGPFVIEPLAIWPKSHPVKGKDGCLLITAVRDPQQGFQKIYRKVWFFREDAVKLGEPVIDSKGNFQGDESVSLTLIDEDGKDSRGVNLAKGKAPTNGTLRFYTVQGRTLVVRIEGGKSKWTK